MNYSKLQKIVDIIYEYLTAQEQDDGKYPFRIALLDPVANRIVGSHYALSHYCAGLYLQSHLKKNNAIRKRADAVFRYVLDTHHDFLKEFDYHHDFNNFAWALLLKLNTQLSGLLPDMTRQACARLLIETGDSRHIAVNWLPMRAFNHMVRAELTGKNKFYRKGERLLKEIFAVKNADGFFEDSLKKGTSANPQYHLFTVTVLLVGKHFQCFEFDMKELHDSIGLVIKHIDPDGDFNYYGRGTNQIFGWGPMLFILKNLPVFGSYFEKCSSFVLSHIQNCLQNNGLLLENSIEHQFVTWRFYHYATVYISHLFFWLSVAQTLRLSICSSEIDLPQSNNINILSSDRFFCAVFKGRKRFIAEKGPMLCNLWVKKRGSIFKGPFGPFNDCPPTKYDHITKTAVIANYLGPLIETCRNDCSLSVSPVFPQKIDLVEDCNALRITYSFKRAVGGSQFNLPVFGRLALTEDVVNQILKLSAGNDNLSFFRVGSIIGPYHELDVYRTKPIAPTLELILTVRNE